MQVTVFGANGKVGSRVVKTLLSKDYQVVAFVHKAHNMPINPNLTIVQGDIHNPKDVASALTGSEAVVSALGSWGTPSKDILTEGMKAIVPAMKTLGISRIVSLTGADAWDPTDKPSLPRRLNHFVLGLIASRVLRDGEQHIELLRASDLDWTVIRSPVMGSTNSKSYELGNTSPKPWQIIPRDAVAAAMVDSVEQGLFIGESPYIKAKHR